MKNTIAVGMDYLSERSAIIQLNSNKILPISSCGETLGDSEYWIPYNATSSIISPITRRIFDIEGIEAIWLKQPNKVYVNAKVGYTFKLHEILYKVCEIIGEELGITVLYFGDKRLSKKALKEVVGSLQRICKERIIYEDEYRRKDARYWRKYFGWSGEGPHRDVFNCRFSEDELKW